MLMVRVNKEFGFRRERNKKKRKYYFDLYIFVAINLDPFIFNLQLITMT